MRFDLTPPRRSLLIPLSFTTYAVTMKNKDVAFIRTAKKSCFIQNPVGKNDCPKSFNFQTSDDSSVFNVFDTIHATAVTLL